jgi:hypothetical protein
MPSMQNAINNHEYRSVPITALAESATNPRKRFDPKSLEELASYVPGHIIRLLCPGSFWGRECPPGRQNGDLHLRRAHNVRSRTAVLVGRNRSPSKLSDSAEPQSAVCSLSRDQTRKRVRLRSPLPCSASRSSTDPLLRDCLSVSKSMRLNAFIEAWIPLRLSHCVPTATSTKPKS